jgi:hypothetical protein
VTIAELAVVLVLVGLVGSTIGLSLIRQQRFYRGASELLRAREGVRDAMELLSTDIRGMAAADTVRLRADSAIEFFAPIGGSVVCRNTGGTTIGLPPASGRGNTLTSFVTQPDTGDIAIFHRDSIDGGSESDIDAGSMGYAVDLAIPLSSHVGMGAPVRFIRRGRYSLYRASDGEWYLGYRRCNAVGVSSCGGIQPLSGPYRGYSSNPRNTGLLLEYFDASGARLPPGESPLTLARVDITARAESRQRIEVEGRTTIPSDSATVSVAVRNRSP